MNLGEALAATQPAALANLEDRALVEELERRGWITHRDDPHQDRHVPLDVPERGTLRFVVVSDTHLGSKQQQLTLWRRFYDEARDFRPEFVLHAGDAVDGSPKMHRDTVYGQFVHGFDAVTRYATERWPIMPDKRGRPIPQWVIGGNHDGSFFNDNGANVLASIAALRDDIRYLGAPTATFHASGLDVMLMHPDGGVPYARSYKLQKIVEQMPADTKPHILLCGHWHVPCHVTGYRNVEAMSLMCFQSQTPYLRMKGLAPVVGGLMCEATYSSSGLDSLKTHWVRYPSTVDKDWP